MKYRKCLLAFCLIMCVLFCVSSVAASDVNDTAIVSDVNDTAISSDDTIVNEETLTSDDFSDDSLVSNQNNGSATSSDDAVLTDDNQEEGGNDETDTANVIFYKETGKYANDKKIYIKVADAKTNEAVGIDDQIIIEVINTKTKDSWWHGVNIGTDGKGELEWKETGMGDGNFILKLVTESAWHSLIDEEVDLMCNETTITVYKNNVEITAKKLSVPYQSTKKFTIKVVGSDKKVVANAALKVKIHNGKKWVTYQLNTDSKGIATFNKVSKLSVGKHKVLISIDGAKDANKGLSGKQVASYITIGKMSVVIKPTKLSAAYKSGKYFKAKVINSKTKKAVKGVTITLKIDNKKTVKLKSNAKGIVKYSSSKLKIGKHKVVLKVSSKSHFGKAKTSSIMISKKKKSSSNTVKKAKIKTTIKLSSSSFSTIAKQVFVKMEVTTTQRGDWAYPVYEYREYPKIDFTATLRGPNGKNIAGEYKAILRYSDWKGAAGSDQSTFKGKFGQSKSYTGIYSLNNYCKYVQLEIQFKGNSKYSACKYTSSWIRLGG